MADFLQSKEKGACPVCGRDHDTDCRWTPDLGLVLCHTHGQGGTKRVAMPPDEVAANGGRYIFRKQSSDGRTSEFLLKSDDWQKPPRKQGKTEFVYKFADGSACAKVIRTDEGDGNKKIRQVYRDTVTGEWEKYERKGSSFASNFSPERKKPLMAKVPLYRLPEVLKAIANEEKIWFVEGEGKADLLYRLGLCATTLIAGAGKLKAYNPDALNALRGAKVILCPDRDRPGIAHMDQVEAALSGIASHIDWMYAEMVDHNRLPKSGGYDVGDLVESLKASRDDAAIVAALNAKVGAKSMPQSETKQQEPQLSKREKARADLHAATQAAAEIIKQLLPEIEEENELEAVRSSLSIAHSTWEKQIKRIQKRYQQPRINKLFDDLINAASPAEQLAIRHELQGRFRFSKADIDAELRVRVSSELDSDKPIKPLTIKQLGEMGSQEFEWLIPGYMPKGVSAMLDALPGDGKTLLAIDIAHALTTGGNALGENVKQGKCLFICTDQPLNMTRKYLFDRGFSDDNENLWVVGESPETPGWTALKLKELERMLVEFKPDLVVIDSLRAAVIDPLGLKEESTEVGAWMRKVESLIVSKHGSGLLWIHHSNKQGNHGALRASGSTSITAAVSVGWSLLRTTTEPDCPKRTLNVWKLRGAETQSIEIELEDSAWKYLGRAGESEEVASQMQSIGSIAIDLLEKSPTGLELQEILTELGLQNKDSLKRALNRLANRKIISITRNPEDRRRAIYSKSKNILTPPTPSPRDSCPLLGNKDESIGNTGSQDRGQIRDRKETVLEGVPYSEEGVPYSEESPETADATELESLLEKGMPETIGDSLDTVSPICPVTSNAELETVPAPLSRKGTGRQGTRGGGGKDIFSESSTSRDVGDEESAQGRPLKIDDCVDWRYGDESLSGGVVVALPSPANVHSYRVKFGEKLKIVPQREALQTLSLSQAN